MRGFPSRRLAACGALSALLAHSGLSAVELARVLGRDERSMRRWLSGQAPIPETLAQQIARLRVTGVTATHVRLEWRR